MASVMSCRACRRSLLDSFVSLAIQPRARTSSLIKPERRKLIQPPQRTFVTSRASLNQPARQNDDFLAENSEEDSGTAPLPNTSTTSSLDTLPTQDMETHIPWYLRVEPPAPIAKQLAPNLAAQEIPPLPEDSPRLLDPILQHLSISIGLDHLTIIDLRGLNPPSALGSNLLMVLGTARSEKHLNTSADRFCRWLRSTYKLRPFADGLLGRNELKLKLRRRNKKLRLAQSVGNTMYDGKSYDDGITTGWVCCNLGDVSLAQIPENEAAVNDTKELEHVRSKTKSAQLAFSATDEDHMLEDDEPEYTNPSDDDFKYRGFGTASDAPRIVVQMFTEEKRLEMDLEGLWESRLKRREVKRQKVDDRLQYEGIGLREIEAEVDDPQDQEQRARGTIAAR